MLTSHVAQFFVTDEEWCRTLTDLKSAAQDGAVSFTHHYTFPDGDEFLSEASVRFRTEGEVRTSLHDANFCIEQIYGGWQHEPVGARSIDT